ncbi:MAG: hypothetical protein ACI9BW_004222, partial [Gammaproteobacteria bacterium]
MNFKVAKQLARARTLKSLAVLALLSGFLTANAQEPQWRTLDNISSED